MKKATSTGEAIEILKSFLKEVKEKTDEEESSFRDLDKTTEVLSKTSNQIEPVKDYLASTSAFNYIAGIILSDLCGLGGFPGHSGLDVVINNLDKVDTSKVD